MKRLEFSGRLMCILTALILVVSLGVTSAEEPGRYDKDTLFSFHFDEGKGKETSDFSGNDNHGNLGGGKEPNWVDGPDKRFGTALEFFDSNYVEIPESPSLDTAEEVTFEAWLNLKSLTANWSTLYSKHAQGNAVGFHWIYINKDGTLVYQYANGAAYIAPSFKVNWEFGKWTHVAITHRIDGDKGGVIKWYIDGVEAHEVKHTDKALQVIGGKASLGTYQSNPAADRYEFDGMMDEVRVSPRVKTEAEIAESMNAFAVEPHQKLADMWGRIKSTN
ncbi:LamG domain-containing protein [Candidatus Poribacteria bacterium]